VECRPFVRQRHRSGGAIYEPHAQPLFQPGQFAADRHRDATVTSLIPSLSYRSMAAANKAGKAALKELLAKLNAFSHDQRDTFRFSADVLPLLAYAPFGIGAKFTALQKVSVEPLNFII
jgi:hypothetical protein